MLSVGIFELEVNRRKVVMKRTKRITVVMLFLVAFVSTIWWAYTFGKAEAKGELLTLLVQGQVSMPTWRPIIPMPELVDVLKEGQLGIYQQARSVLAARIARIESKPAGYYVSVLDPGSTTGQARVPKEDWLSEIAPALAALDAHIARLQS